MSVKTVTHLNFRGDAHAALDFYEGVFGGEKTIVTYADAHQAQNAARPEDVIWGQVAASGGFCLMAYDVQSALGYDQGENAFYVSVASDSADEIRSFWKGLSDGATVEADLGPSMFSPLYGKLKDRFGVVWVIQATAA